MRLLVIVGVLGLACTKPNPRSCIDSDCNDPAFPFCDIDGTFGGQPLECIAIECTPNEFQACRNSDAVSCNEIGSDLLVEECPFGCDDAIGGCRACATNVDCADDALICDLDQNACRTCAIDGECDSQVCDRGRCADAANVYYASSTGSAAAPCTVDDPCAAATAVARAIAAGGPRVVHLAMGTYGPLLIPSTATQLTLVGHDATLDGLGGGLDVNVGASVVARSLTITGDNDAIVCGRSAGATAKLTLSNSHLVQKSSGTRLVLAVSCRVEISNTELRIADTGTTDAVPVVVNTDGAFIGDRLHVHGLKTSTIGMIGQRMNLAITNSLLENVTFQSLASDSTAPGSRATFAWNTFVGRNPDNVFDCSLAGPNRAVVFENNIVFGTAVSSVLTGTGCVLQTNLLSPQTSLPLNNITGNPQFADVATGNFRLKPSSPALGAASSTLSTPTDHDYTGASRPQGTAPDIGAFEQ